MWWMLQCGKSIKLSTFLSLHYDRSFVQSPVDFFEKNQKAKNGRIPPGLQVWCDQIPFRATAWSYFTTASSWRADGCFGLLVAWNPFSIERRDRRPTEFDELLQSALCSQTKLTSLTFYWVRSRIRFPSLLFLLFFFPLPSVKNLILSLSLSITHSAISARLTCECQWVHDDGWGK